MLYTDIMIDLETVGLTPKVVILEIGIVAFNMMDTTIPVVSRSYMPDPEVQATMGRSIDWRTMKWWLQQDPVALHRVMFPHEVCHPRDAAISIRDWLQNMQINVWAWPSTFDIPILEDWFRDVGVTPPWSHRDIRCARTVCKYRNVQIDRSEGLAHSAVDDCLAQVKALRAAHG